MQRVEGSRCAAYGLIPASGPLPHQHACPLTLQGRIFIDRSGTLFDEVLSLLRDGPEWRPPGDRCVLRPTAGSAKGGQGGREGATALRPGLVVMAKEQQMPNLSPL